MTPDLLLAPAPQEAGPRVTGLELRAELRRQIAHLEADLPPGPGRGGVRSIGVVELTGVAQVGHGTAFLRVGRGFEPQSSTECRSFC